MMRVDHHAFQRATKVAGMGLLLQTAIGLLVLIFGLISHDISFVFASAYILAGFLVWLGLIIVFYQHRLERLEALEDDELASTRSGSGSFFDRAEETRVAARRLTMMHKWLMPAFSILLAVLLAGTAWLMIRYMNAVADGALFLVTAERGWAVAICLSMAAISFIFSRFIAGMAKQEAWHNLRGGAAYMVGNAIVLVAVAVGIIFIFFENQSVIRAVAWGIPIFLAALALEVVLNFVLNLYRPRIPGEIPRPAFDSKALSLLATPDSIVRSLNEAVNYQFGFDVTSSWGYQLLLRSFASLVILGVVVLVLLSTMVVVEPHQQAIRLRGGRIVGDRVYDSGVMWKLPWPIETAEVYDVSRIRSFHLTEEARNRPDVNLWSAEESPATVSGEKFEKSAFIVGSPRAAADLQTAQAVIQPVNLVEAPAATNPDAGGLTSEDRAAQAVSNYYSLVDAEIVLQYRIRRDANGLLDYLSFAPENVARRQALADRERALKHLALGEVSSHFSRLSLDEVLSPGRTKLSGDLIRLVQKSFDDHRTGVEVISIDMPMLKPSGLSAPNFEDFGIQVQNAQQITALAERNVYATFISLIGDPNTVDEVLGAIDEYDRLAREKGTEDPETIKQRQSVETKLMEGRGEAAQIIADAQANRWIDLMNKQVQDSLVRGEIDSYTAAPELYRTRELMKMFKRLLPYRNKIILGIDPSRVNIDFDLKSINPAFNFAGASEEEKKR